MRNFWMTADIDGRATELAGGPRGKDGGMDITVKWNNHGESEDTVKVYCNVHTNGNLVIRVTDANGKEIHYAVTSKR